jgi:NAD(P)H-dependent FMN reductase
MRVLGVCGSLQAKSGNLALLKAAASSMPGGMDLIRFGGHLRKGGYDVRNGRDTQPTAASAIHG